MDDFRFVNHGFRHVLLFILRRSACFVTARSRFLLKNIVWVLQLTLFMQALEDGREKNVTFAKIYGNKVYAYGKLYPF